MEPQMRTSTHNNIVDNEEEPSINHNNETERNRIQFYYTNGISFGR